MSEVDQHIELIKHRIQIAGQIDANLALRHQLTDIRANQAAIGTINRRAQACAIDQLHGFDQGLAHAPSGAHHSNTLHSYQLQAVATGCSRRLATAQPVSGIYRSPKKRLTPSNQIGRASWRERVEISV